MSCNALLKFALSAIGSIANARFTVPMNLSTRPFCCGTCLTVTVRLRHTIDAPLRCSRPETILTVIQ